MNMKDFNTKTFSTFLIASFLAFIPSIKSEMPFNPPKNMTLLPGPGFLHHPVTTRNPLAQRFFDQGLTMIYAFNHEAAYGLFQKAVDLDPQMAMAYWGMALALGANINTEVSAEKEKQAYLLTQQALKLADQTTKNERAYIEALSKRYSNDPNPDYKQLNVHYYNAMKDVVNRFPDDLDAATLFAESGLDLHPWDQWTLDGEPKEGTLEIVAVLESVLNRDPEHIGANHYYIHAIEASKYPERAWKHADRLRHKLPVSGHLNHMPSHIYMLVGDYQNAAEANEAAVAADHAYIRQYGRKGYYPLHYMSHNLSMLTRSYMMAGNFRNAIRAGEELDAFYTPQFQLMPDLEYYQTVPMLVLLRFHRWNDILKMPPPPGDMLLSNAFWHYGRAMAYAAIGEERLAQDEQQRLQNAMKQLPKDSMYGSNPSDKILSIANLLVSAKLKEKQGDLLGSIPLLQEAIQLEDQLLYSEPPNWYYPIRESLGATLFKAGRFREAEDVFREALVKYRRDGWALFGLLESLKAQNRPQDAYWVQQDFERAWKNSDFPLTINDL